MRGPVGIAFVLLFAVFALSSAVLLSACAPASTQIGGFSVTDSSSYGIREGNRGLSTVIDGHDVRGCDALAMEKGSDFVVALTWYEGIAFEEYRAHMDGRSLDGDVSDSLLFSQTAQDWVTAEKRVTNQEDIELKGGIPAYVYEVETVADLGEPYSFKSKEVLFPTSDDAVGIISYSAYSPEQLEVESALLDEVLDNLIIGS